MKKHKVDSGNNAAGAFDMTAMPALWAKIIAAEKADKTQNVDKHLIIDVCLNQDGDSFSGDDVIDQISQDYGIEVTAADVSEAIEELYECGMLEPARCDKTIDLFNGQPDAKKPLSRAAFL